MSKKLVGSVTAAFVPHYFCRHFVNVGYYAKKQSRVNDRALLYLGKKRRASFVHLSFSNKATIMGFGVWR